MAEYRRQKANKFLSPIVLVGSCMDAIVVAYKTETCIIERKCISLYHLLAVCICYVCYSIHLSGLYNNVSKFNSLL